MLIFTYGLTSASIPCSESTLNWNTRSPFRVRGDDLQSFQDPCNESYNRRELMAQNWWPDTWGILLTFRWFTSMRANSKLLNLAVCCCSENRLNSHITAELYCLKLVLTVSWICLYEQDISTPGMSGSIGCGCDQQSIVVSLHCINHACWFTVSEGKQQIAAH